MKIQFNSRFLFLLFFLYGSPGSLYAQGDSLTIDRFYFRDFKKVPGIPVDLSPIVNDSILKLSQFYDIARQQKAHAPATGNPGSAVFIDDDFERSLKFINDGFNQFDPYLIHPLKRRFGNAPFKRFTNINYHLASKKEQHIFISHEQQIQPWFIVGLDFGAMTSEGDFSRQLNTNRNFDIYLAYEAPSSVYRTYLSFTSNRVLNQENGGITTDSVFENASSLDARTLPVYLDNAEITQKTRDYFFQQDLNLSRLFSKRDSSMRSFKSNSFVLSTSTWWSRKSVLFTSSNPDSGYFANVYFDTVQTRDSSFYDDLYNVAMIEYTSPDISENVQFSIGGGVENQQLNYFTYDSDTKINQTSLVASARITVGRMLAGMAFFKEINGDCKDCYRGNVDLSFRINKNGDRAIVGFALRKSPVSIKDQWYVSKHFIWKNNFNLQEQFDVKAGFGIQKYKLNVLMSSNITKNRIFYREDYLPQSYGDFIAVSTLTIDKIFNVAHFGSDNKVELSQSGNEQVVSVPLFATYTSLYYHNIFFKGALGFKAGFDVNYFTEYYGYGYMPATGVFYIQDEKKIGNYPRLGAFVNLKIKTASLFLKLENFNAGLTERTYYGALHYPSPGRTFKFGISWDFKD